MSIFVPAGEQLTYHYTTRKRDGKDATALLRPRLARPAQLEEPKCKDGARSGAGSHAGSTSRVLEVRAGGARSKP